MERRPAGRLAWLGLLYLTQGLAPAFVAFALPVILRRDGMSLEAIGLTTLLFWPTALRFLIGPLIDRVQTGGKRRWLVPELAIGLALAMALLALVSPGRDGAWLFGLLGLLVLGSAVLDVAVGGLTLRLVEPEQRRLASALQYAGYYAGSIVAGGMFLAVEAWAGWVAGVLLLAALAAIGAGAALVLRGEQPRFGAAAPARWREYLPARTLWPVLFVVFLIDLPQNAGIALTGPALVDAGLVQEEVALLTGSGGLAAAIGGAMAAGLLGRRLRGGTAPALLALVQAAALLPLALVTGMEQPGLVAASLAVALAYAAAAAFNVALLAWCMERANPDKAATELALLASVHSLSYVAAGPVAGWAAGRFDFPLFLSTAAGLAAGVALLLLPLLRQPRGRAAV